MILPSGYHHHLLLLLLPQDQHSPFPFYSPRLCPAEPNTLTCQTATETTSAQHHNPARSAPWIRTEKARPQQQRLLVLASSATIAASDCLAWVASS